MTTAISPLRALGFVAAAGLLLFGAGCATAPSERPFDVADADGDERISKAELEHYVSGGLFAHLDADGDGRVPADEWRRFDATLTDAMFAERDADGDGSVTHAEMKAFFDRQDSLDRIMDQIDTNRDGHIDRAEADAYREAIRRPVPEAATR